MNATQKGETKMKKGYVNFDSKNWGYAGDKQTWANYDGDYLTVKRASKGLISEAYENEMTEFCAKHGIDFSDVKPGQAIKIKI